ncbi:unnamed protein product [Alopecurus aequalis]
MISYLSFRMDNMPLTYRVHQSSAESAVHVRIRVDKALAINPDGSATRTQPAYRDLSNNPNSFAAAGRSSKIRARRRRDPRDGGRRHGAEGETSARARLSCRARLGLLPIPPARGAAEGELGDLGVEDLREMAVRPWWVVAVARASAEGWQRVACNPETLPPDRVLALLCCGPLHLLLRFAAFLCVPFLPASGSPLRFASPRRAQTHRLLLLPPTPEMLLARYSPSPSSSSSSSSDESGEDDDIEGGDFIRPHVD